MECQASGLSLPGRGELGWLGMGPGPQTAFPSLHPGEGPADWLAWSQDQGPPGMLSASQVRVGGSVDTYPLTPSLFWYLLQASPTHPCFAPRLAPKAFRQMTVVPNPGSPFPSCSVQLLPAWGSGREWPGPPASQNSCWAVEGRLPVPGDQKGKGLACAHPAELALARRGQGSGLRTAGWDSGGRRGPGPGWEAWDETPVTAEY